MHHPGLSRLPRQRKPSFCRRQCEPRLRDRPASTTLLPPLGGKKRPEFQVCNRSRRRGFTALLCCSACGAVELMLSATTQLLSKKKRRMKPRTHNQKHNVPFLITSGITYGLRVKRQRFPASKGSKDIKEMQSKATGSKPGHAGKVLRRKTRCD